MEKRPVLIDVTDHAVVRWLERDQGLDIEAVRRHLAGRAVTGAELGARAVQLGRVRLILKDMGEFPSGAQLVTIVTASPRYYGRPVR